MSQHDDILVFFRNSADKPAGKGSGEKVADPNAYKELNGISDWRKVLAPQDASCGVFTYNGRRYKSIAHAAQAERAKYDGVAQTQLNKWSVNSGAPDSSVNNPSYELKGKKESKWAAEEHDKVYHDIALAKYTSCEAARRVLLATKRAQLHLNINGATKKRCTWLEQVRLELQGSHGNTNNGPRVSAAPSTSTQQPPSKKPSTSVDADELLAQFGGMGLGKNERAERRGPDGRIMTEDDVRWQKIRAQRDAEKAAENAAIRQHAKNARKSTLALKHQIMNAKHAAAHHAPAHEPQFTEADIKKFLLPKIAEAAIRDQNLPANIDTHAAVSRVCEDLARAILSLGLSRNDTKQKIISIGSNISRPAGAKEMSLVSRLITGRVSARDVVAAATSRDYYPSINAGSHQKWKQQVQAAVQPAFLTQHMSLSHTEEREVDAWEASYEFQELMSTIKKYVSRMYSADSNKEFRKELKLSMMMRDAISRYVVHMHREAKYSREHLLDMLKDKTEKVNHYLENAKMGGKNVGNALAVGEITCAEVVTLAPN